MDSFVFVDTSLCKWVGGADEHVLVAELNVLGKIYALTSFDYFTSDRLGP